jgi:2-polyprenyl-3-methyl-5-hydroxy-6-metoxy-1,4-benzoquinol methylase
MIPKGLRHKYRLFDRAYEFLGDAVFLRAGIDNMLDEYGDGYLVFVEDHLGRLLDSLAGDEDRFMRNCESLVELTYDVLRMQSEFNRKGTAARYSAEELEEKVYRNRELMEGPYLGGLYFALVFWPNHYRKVLFYRERFLPLIPSGGSLLDIGCGTGAYAAFARLRDPALRVTLNDISPFSLDMAKAINDTVATKDGGGLEFVEGGFQQFVQKREDLFDSVLFSEVIEHMPDPHEALPALRTLLAPGAHVFFATATNAAFYDHTIVFSDIEEIENLILQNGFEVVEYSTEDVFQSRQPVEVKDYFAIIRSAG